MDKIKMIKTDCNCGFEIVIKLLWSNLSITATLGTEENDRCGEVGRYGR